MKKYNIVLGLISATVLTTAMIPVRLSQGQGSDPYNLIGSEIVIWVMCLTAWCATYHIQLQSRLPKWAKLGLSLLTCAVLSNLFYYASNPFFEDYPLSPMLQYPFGIALLRLSIRGLLMGLIIVPIAFLFENERQRHRAELDSQIQRVIVSEEQKHLLEVLVAERTRTLESTLLSLQKSESELDNQVYVLSRLVASVTHDVSSPLNYVVIVAEQIQQFLQSGRPQKAVEYTQELLKAVTGISVLMNNLLEFTKTQVRQESIVLTDIDMSTLIEEKAQLFEGIIGSKKNELFVRINPGFTIHTNYNLVAIVLHNLIDNATRYTDGGIISITGEQTITTKTLTIENSINSGLKTLSYPDSDQYAEPRESGVSPQQSKGIGLILVSNISALLNIDFSFEIKSDKAVAYLNFNDHTP